MYPRFLLRCLNRGHQIIKINKDVSVGLELIVYISLELLRKVSEHYGKIFCISMAYHRYL
jgi:hypothetical protein